VWHIHSPCATGVKSNDCNFPPVAGLPIRSVAEVVDEADVVLDASREFLRCNVFGGVGTCL